jgi:AraC-like DNA-binding protein
MQFTEKLILDKEIKDSFQIKKLNNTVFDGGNLVSVVNNRIFIIHEGTGNVMIDENYFEINDQEIILISKAQVFSFSNGTKLSGFEIIFGNCFWEKTPASASNCKQLLFNDAALHQKMLLQEKDFSELNPVCEMMFDEFSAEDYPNKLDAMAAYLKILMIKLANLAPSFHDGIDDFDNQTYRKFLELVSSEYIEMHDVQYYADRLSVTPRKLSDISKKKSGKGAKEIIAGQIVAESKRNLQFTTKTIKEIAYGLSFSTPEQFSHFFKKYTQISPLDYRKIFVNIGR